MGLSFPSIWVPGSSFILASCLIGKEAISSILLDQWFLSPTLVVVSWQATPPGVLANVSCLFHRSFASLFSIP